MHSPAKVWHGWLTIVLMVLGGPASLAATLTRGPYVQMGHFTNAVTLVWRTDTSSDSWVDYGLTSAYGSTVSGASGWQHEVTLTNLLSGTTYHYRVRSAGVNLATGVFMSGKSPGQPFRIGMFSDAHWAGARGCGQRMWALKPDLLLAAGDITDEGTFAQLDQNLFTNFWEILRYAPLYWTPGNHDVANSFGACREAFVLPHDELNYWFEYGDAQIVSLNSEGLPGTNWLVTALASSPKTWKIVFFHQAARSASGGHGENATIRDQYVPVMERHGVQLVVSGHNHYYWRSAPINGITFLVDGVTGDRRRDLGAMPCYSAAGVAGTSTKAFGLADVNGYQTIVRGIAESGAVLDESMIDLECPFQLDGLLDAGAMPVASRSGGLSIWAAIRGRYLYVATQDAGEGNDHFVLFSRSSTARMTNAPWAKAGSVMAYDGCLADENDNNYSRWFLDDDREVGDLYVARSASRWCNGEYNEGVIDLQLFYGEVPPVLHLAAAPYGNNDGNAMVPAQQCPAGDGNGNIEPAEFVAVPSAAILAPFVMNGLVDSAPYELADNNGMKLWAAVHSNTLYVATWSAAGGANDHFIFVTDAPGAMTNAPWAKAGQVAFDVAAKPYLGNESAYSFAGWFNGGANARATAWRSYSGYVEGTLDLREVFGSVPPVLYFAAAPYTTPDGGALVASRQVPAGNGNGHVEANEFLAVSVASIRDENLDGLHDGDLAPPAVPSNLVAIATGSDRIALSWAASAGAQAYIIRRDGQVIGATSATNYLNTGLSPNTYYCYTVAATNASGGSAESAPACATTPAPPPPPPTPSNVTATAVAYHRIDLSWSASAGATGYRVIRDGSPIAVTASTNYSSTNLTADTRFCYEIVATNVTGSSAPSVPVCATTPVGLPIVMDGVVDHSAYEIADHYDMKLWVAVRGQTLYVATWAAGDSSGPHDHFIYVTDVIGVVTSTPWAKAGTVAYPRRSKPYLADESVNDFEAWYNAGASATQASAAVSSGQLEGTLNLVEAFGYVPERLYVAAAGYTTTNGGVLVWQAPAGNGDWNVDTNEFLVVPVAAIRDENHDGLFDILDGRRNFAVQSVFSAPAEFTLTWPAIPGRSYRVWHTDDLKQPFQPLSGTLTAAQGQFALTITDSSMAGLLRRFYRLQLFNP